MYMRKLINLDLKLYLKKVVVPIVVITCLAMPIPLCIKYYLHESWTNVIINCTLSVSLICILCFTIGLNKSEKQLVYSIPVLKKTYVILRFPRTRSSRSSITSESEPPETLHTGFCNCSAANPLFSYWKSESNMLQYIQTGSYDVKNRTIRKGNRENEKSEAKWYSAYFLSNFGYGNLRHRPQSPPSGGLPLSGRQLLKITHWPFISLYFPTVMSSLENC